MCEVDKNPKLAESYKKCFWGFSMEINANALFVSINFYECDNQRAEKLFHIVKKYNFTFEICF